MDKINVLLSDNCRFHLGDIPDAWQAWYDDSQWERVMLPHDWSVDFPFSRECSSGTGYLPGGIGWYRLHITPDPSWQGKRISITFDGIYKNSRIWCNSYYLGERPNGYISFTYDITHAFRFDTENIISVYVDRRELADSRWFTGCGITRKVTLHIEETVHPVPDGIFFSTWEVSEQQALFRVENQLINTRGENVTVKVNNHLFRHTGELVATAASQTTITAHGTNLVVTEGILDAPTLWSPDTPYLYTLQTTLQVLEDATTAYTADTVSVGIRTYSFDPDKGFFLNNRPTKLKGVCVHHDAGCLGAAVLPQVWQRRLTKLKTLGCNAIRMSHNPHMPELYALCDSMGFLVIDEAFDEWEGPKNKWSIGHNVYPPKHQGYYVDFHTWHEKDLVDMIRRDRNHPSVILWSIGNEIDYPNDPYCHPSFDTMTGNNDANKPAQERQYNSLRPNAERLAVVCRQLCDIVKKTDTTHPVTLAAAFPELSAKLGFIDPLDVVGYNYKEHLYRESHAAFPHKPFLGSENSHSYAAWRAVTDNEYISGQFLWTGIDYLGESRGIYPFHGSDAGVLTTAGFEKAGYYRRQSFWSDAPMVHLVTTPVTGDNNEFTPMTQHWNYSLGEKLLVKCYTNLPQVEILLNDHSLGIFPKEDDTDCISLEVDYAPGELRAREVNNTVTHSLYTTGKATHFAVHTWEQITSEYTDIILFQTEITLLDENEKIVRDRDVLCDISVENGLLWGVDNGNLGDGTAYSSTQRSTFNGQLIAYVATTNTTVPVLLHISAEGIPDRTEELCLNSSITTQSCQQ